MKRTLLSTFIVFLFAIAAHAQLGECNGCDDGQYNSNDSATKTSIQKPKKKKVSVFPNPAVNYIGLSEEDEKSVSKLVVLNVMGRKAKNFEIEKGMRYDVSDLKRGMYLIQIFDLNNKIITTQRLNKS